MQRFDPSTGTLVAADWPDPFRPMVARWNQGGGGANAPGHSARVSFIDDLSDIPAVVLPPQPDILRLTTDARLLARTRDGLPAEATAAVGPPTTAAHLVVASPPSATVLLWLDLDEIRRVLLPSLVRKYFASDDVFDYQVTVRLRRDPSKVLFETEGASGEATRRHAASDGDLVVPMFRARMTELIGTRQAAVPRQSAPRGGGATSGSTEPHPQQAYAVSIMRYEAALTAPTNTIFALADAAGGWQLRLAHRSGSLEAAVQRLRTRNLAVSSTILGLLVISLGFVLVSTRRARRLASQQVEFVASVSHELRTPLSVIRSAGENLADGVVDAPDQVRRYGALVAEEGRKLGAMVDQVMEYAGMQSDQPRWQMAPVDLRAMVEEAAAGARRLPEARDATIDVEVEDGLPPLEGDRAALVRAVQNLVENALKYGQARRDSTTDSRQPWVGVRLFAAEGSVAIEVSDRGAGIEAGERRKIFEPFVRGRAAAARHVPGNGLGLSIVRRVAEGHGGTVDVSTNADGGASFTIVLRTQNDERRTTN